MTEVELFNIALAEVGDYRIDLDSSFTVSSATAANPVVATTSAAHGYSTDDLVLITEMDEMTLVNGRVFKIVVVTTTTFQLVGEDGSSYTAETTGGLCQKLSTGRQVTAIFNIWPSMRSEVLAEAAWNEATRKDRLARLDNTQSITAITAANPAVVTIASHGYSQGDTVKIADVGGMVELLGEQGWRFFTVGNPDTNTFELAGEDSTDYTAYTSGGTAAKALTPLKPDFGYDRRYTAPSDMVRILSFEDPGQRTEQWERVGSEIHTDAGITVPIRYTYLLKDPSKFSAQLATAFAARLAYELAPILTDSVSREERAERRWDKQSRRAKRTDSREQSHSEIEPGSWLNERLR